VNELFGVSMTTIMEILVGLFAVCALSVLAIYLSNRLMFRMGLRNIGRRRAQTTLVVAGLMLATLIITAAFSTGDTLDHTMTNGVYQLAQRTDLRLRFGGTSGGGRSSLAQVYTQENIVPIFESEFADDPDIEGFLPFLMEPVPAIDERTKLSEPTVNLVGFDAARLSPLGGLRLVKGGHANLASLGENQGFMSKSTAGRLDARAGDRITVFAGGMPFEIEIAGVVEDEFASGVTDAMSGSAGGIALHLATVQRITGHEGEISELTVALKGGVRGSLDRADPAAERLEAFLASDQGKSALGLGELGIDVQKIKKDNVELSELIGNLFTTIFLVLGLFSIAAGVMLIFMLFVMLAAERRTEMGIARAVGAARIHLVQTFMAEGMVYDVLAGAFGALLGVGAAFLILVVAMRLVLGDEFPGVAFYVAPRSLVVSYCLGVVITFVTVGLSAVRISVLNIVAAVRGQADQHVQRHQRRKTHWLWVGLGVPAMLIPPLGLWFLLRKGLGLPWAWITGPAGIVLGGILLWLGEVSNLAFPWALGVSLLPLSIAEMARNYGAPNRPTWSAAGAALAIYWLMPMEVEAKIFGERDGNMEMFVLSGIMIVTGLTLVIVFNARLLTTLFATGESVAQKYRSPIVVMTIALVFVALALLAGNSANGLGQLGYLFAAVLAFFAVLAFMAAHYPWFAPALRMGVAYPLANRFRTGMTIAMFSLVVFSMTVMGIINASMLQLFAGDDATAGWDIIATTNPNNPINDLPATLRDNGFDTSIIKVAGRTTSASGAEEVRQAGREKWEPYPVRAGDAAFYRASQTRLESRARGYFSDYDAFEAVRTQPNLAIIDSAPLQGNSGFGPGAGFSVRGIKAQGGFFEPFDLEFRDPTSGKIQKVTVVGVLSGKIPSFGYIWGVYVNETTYSGIFGTPNYEDVFLRLNEGVNSEKAAKGIEAALVTKGVQADSLQKMVDDMLSQSRGFMRIFQAFMGLGLLVGIAALGVIALRSVVERRQQIGMLRAIGYQKGTVAMSFLLESGFIALMGILSGVVGATILAWNLLSSDWFSSNEDLTFFIPWSEIALYNGLAFGFAMLMTWWPSERASSVPIADALRYE